MLEGFTDSARNVIMGAQQEAHLLGHKYISTEHILLALIGEAGGLAAKALQSAKIDLKVMREQAEKLFGRGGGFSGSFSMDLRFTHEAKRVLDLSQEESHKLGHKYIETRDLLLGLLRGCDAEITRLLQNQGANVNNIRDQVIRHMAGENEQVASLNIDNCGQGSSNNNQKLPLSVSNIQNTKNNQMPNFGAKNHQTPILDLFGTNLTKLAKEGKLHPFVARQDELERVIQIFCRRMKNNPCLVGESGVGKTAIIEGLAQRIINGSVPPKLRGKKVITLEVTRLLYGNSCQYIAPEERTRYLIREIEESGDVILFIKQIHTFFETTTKGTCSSAYVLRHALESGAIQCISSTTVNEHRKHIENDEALKKIFQCIDVNEPSVEETIKILKGLRGMYGIHHKVQYTDEALEAAAKLSQKYICGRFLPDKAIDLIDEAGSRVQHFPTQEKKKSCNISPQVTKSDIQCIVSSWTGIPVSDVSKEEGDRLLKLEDKLRGHVIGQNDAINSISRAIRRARLGLGNIKRPIASFMFTGATGVGKTELAKALALHYFGSEHALIRLDMSEYNERHTASRLIGAPPGYTGFDEGGQLTEAVRHRPHALVLFDEIEKAHSDVFNLMLQILDDGRLTDGKGHTVDFNNTLIIMTSNIGNNIIEEFSIVSDDQNQNQNTNQTQNVDCIVKKKVMEELKQHFRPEFLNRFDEIIVFKQLTKMDVKQIANLMLKEVSERLKAKDMQLDVTCKFRDHVVELAYDPSFGARPLRRMISRMLEDALAEKMLTKEIKEGDSVVVDIGSEGNVIVLNQNNINNGKRESVSSVRCIMDLSKDGEVAIEKIGKENGISCNFMGKMLRLDLLGPRRS